MHRDIEPGEWQREPGPCGRRYRMVGNTIEYEAVVAIDGLQIPESQLADYTRRMAEAERNAPPPPPRRDCPFSSGMNTDCTREACALFLDGCTLARLADRPPAKATKGLQCPFSRYRSKCREACALYKDGCTLTGIATRSGSEGKQE